MIPLPKDYTILMGQAHDALYSEKENNKDFLSFDKQLVKELKNWGLTEREIEIFELGIYYVLEMNVAMNESALNN